MQSRPIDSGGGDDDDDGARSPLLPTTVNGGEPTRLTSAMCNAVDMIGRSPRCYSSPNLVQLCVGRPASSNRLADSDESSRSTSSVEILGNITELPPIDAFSTSSVLHYCKRKILVPYQRFLSLLGWRSPIATGESCICTWFLLRVHVLVVVLFTVFGYVLQYAACFRRDIVDGYKLIVANPAVPLYATNHNGSNDGPPPSSLPPPPMPIKEHLLMSDVMVCNGPTLGLYLMPDVLHLCAYCYTYYLLRWCESEQLQVLMERVFLQAFYSRSNYITQPKLVRTLRVGNPPRIFLGLSLAWIALSTTVQISHVLAEFPFFTWMQPSHKEVEVLLIVLLVLTMTWNDVIQVTIIMSYSIQCQLLNSLIRGLCERVREKTIGLQEAIKEINESSKILKHLNDDFAVSVSLMMLHSGVLATSGVLWAFRSESRLDEQQQKQQHHHYHHLLTLTTNALSIVMWTLIFLFPLVQAARLSATCHCIKKLGLFLLTRPFGYQDVNQNQLDSFLLYTASLDMQAKLFRIPVKPAVLFAVMAASVFVVLVLSQMEVISL